MLKDVSVGLGRASVTKIFETTLCAISQAMSRLRLYQILPVNYCFSSV